MKNLLSKLSFFIFFVCIISFGFAQEEPNKEIDATPVMAAELPAIEPELAEINSDTVVSDSLTPPVSNWKKYWKLSGIVGLKISQTYLMNWAAGGNSNFSGIVYANITLNFKKKRIAWDTNLDTDFGILYSSDFKKYKWRKANDKINFTSTFGFGISPEEHLKSIWFVAANATFKSQYSAGYHYPVDSARRRISNWVSPSYTELSIGVNWKWTDLISIYYSPVAGLITSCTDSLLRASYGIPEKKTAMASLGMTFKAGIKYDGVKNLLILSNLQLYTPYTDKEQKFGNIDVDWDFLIAYKFLKVLNVSLTTNLKYYHKVLFAEPGKPKRRVQFQEILGLGIAYSF
jgi:hypothetical protein